MVWHAFDAETSSGILFNLFLFCMHIIKLSHQAAASTWPSIRCEPWYESQHRIVLRFVAINLILIMKFLALTQYEFGKICKLIALHISFFGGRFLYIFELTSNNIVTDVICCIVTCIAM